MLNFFLKTTTFLLILLVIVSICIYIVLPNVPDIKMYIAQFEPQRFSHNLSLSLLTKISPVNAKGIEEELVKETSLEYIDPNILVKYQNEGKVLFNMESQNTTLSISSVNIKGKVVDGENARQLERGFWHFPLSSQPGSKGNIVIIAHRFQYLPPNTNTFFNLDKVKVGDKVIISQEGGTYTYTILEKKIVSNTERSILTQTNDYRLTLITCHPLWSSAQRLVIIAKQDKVYQGV